MKELNLDRFVALDVETTGLDCRKETIIEVAAVRFMNGERTDVLELLINPGRAVPHSITQLTGIEDRLLRDAPKFSDAREDILQFIASDPIVAHNISFDLGFLEYHLDKSKTESEKLLKNRKGYFDANEKHDTVTLARIFLPFHPGFSLSKLAAYFNIKPDKTHRALPDALTTAQLFLELIKISLRTDFRDIRRFIEILAPTDEPLKFYFMHLHAFLASGKYHFEPEFDREELTYQTSLYNIIGEEDTPQNGRLKTEPIDVKEVTSFFDHEGLLQKSFGTFEHRSVQVSMAGEVAKSFNESRFLVVEAGTGTGKSMAYLMPSLAWSLKNYGPFGRVIISTNTKNLQEQLFYKDLPILHSILKKKFKAVLLKGKSNYLCLDKWFTVLNEMKYRLNNYERSKILPLFMWVKNTRTGDISENNGFAVERNISVWKKFIAEDNYCPGKSCKYYNHCFLWRARNNARDAHIVLVNHSLLFSDLAAENSILSEYVNVIFDEAHNIEKVATEYLGVQVSIWDFRETLQKLYSKERYNTGVLVHLQKRIQLSDLESSRKELLMGHLNNLLPLVQTSMTVCQGFFKELTSYLRSILPDKTRNEFTSRFRYRSNDGLYENLSGYVEEFGNYLKQLYSALNDLLEVIRETPSESIRYQKQMYQELLAQTSKLDGLISNLDFLIQAEWDDWVYWFELSGRNDSDDSRLYGAPLKIAEILKEKLFANLKTAVFTSATLAVGRSFDYFKERNGLTLLESDRIRELLLDSPFDYEKQVFLAIPAFMPDPRSADYRQTLKEILKQLIQEQRRGTL
ncbi:MAG: DEAD/DEAH box helicase family protein, partial [Calditrichaeota bacterium]|nr:DEAD/DEAH box helicase family protein [Calditrichota bacterium]